MSEEKVSWTESVDTVSKATLSRILMLKLPPKLLKPLKMQLLQLKKPKLKLDLVLKVMSAALLTPTPY